jgi:hypothetical protein
MDLESNIQTNNIPDHHLEPPQFCKYLFFSLLLTTSRDGTAGA